MHSTSITERQIENQVIQYARAMGMLCLKLNVKGRVGWPDFLLLFKGATFFIEFKKPGEKPTLAQIFIHKEIRSHGILVDVIDDIGLGKQAIRDMIDLIERNDNGQD